MTAELDYVTFTLTKKEIKDLNKYRKEQGASALQFRLRQTGIGLAVEVRPKDCDHIPWENITDYGSW